MTVKAHCYNSQFRLVTVITVRVTVITVIEPQSHQFVVGSQHYTQQALRLLQQCVVDTSLRRTYLLVACFMLTIWCITYGYVFIWSHGVS